MFLQQTAGPVRIVYILSSTHLRSLCIARDSVSGDLAHAHHIQSPCDIKVLSQVQIFEPIFAHFQGRPELNEVKILAQVREVQGRGLCHTTSRKVLGYFSAPVTRGHTHTHTHSSHRRAMHRSWCRREAYTAPFVKVQSSRFSLKTIWRHGKLALAAAGLDHGWRISSKWINLRGHPATATATQSGITKEVSSLPAGAGPVVRHHHPSPGPGPGRLG